MRTGLCLALAVTLAFWATAVQASPISPTSVSGLKLWLDATDASTVTTGTGGKVTAWANKAGGGVGGATATTGQEPTLVSNAMNGRSAIYFNGTSSQYLTGPTTWSLFGTNTTFTGQGTVFVAFIPAKVDSSGEYVMQIDRTGSSSSLLTLAIDATAASGGQVVDNKGGGGVWFRQDASNFNAVTAGNNTSVMQQNQIYLAAYGFDNSANSGSGSLFGDFYRTWDWNNIDLGTVTAQLYYTGVDSNGIVNIGRNGGSPGSRYLTGYIAEILVYDRALSQAEIQGVTEFLEGQLVPEPATWTLLACGAVALGLVARRRGRQANAKP